jgi:uncharacterized membrane protein
LVAREVGETIGTAIGRLAREAARANTRTRPRLSGMRGVAAGAGLAAAAPLLGRGARAVASRGTVPIGALVDRVRGDSHENKRHVPIQEAVDVAVPVATAYKRWTQFKDWPQFMHRFEDVEQHDAKHVAFTTRIWGISKRFEAEITEKRTDERIEWNVTDGVEHTGVVTFHALSDRLTRIEVTIDVQPSSPLEKAARGLGHVQRAVRGDLARFKAHIELEDHGKAKPTRRRSSGGGQQRRRKTTRGR